jgi:glycosyltransferase involved in cell wall biosynthesis
MASEPTISVIVPALNEARNLPHVLPHIPGNVLEVLLVDGNSTDDTIAVATALLPSIRVVQQLGRGKGAALRTGFAAARGDIIVMLDADGSTDPREIPAFVNALTVHGAHFAKGSRFMRGGGTADMPFHRRLGNGAFVLLVRLLFGGGYTDLCYGYAAFWREVVPLLELDADGFEIETMMNVRALKAGLTIAEVPSFEAARVHGVGRLRTIPDGTRVLKTIFRERFTRSRRIAINVGAPGSAEPAGARHSVAVPIEVGGLGGALSDGTMTWGSTSFSEANSMDRASHEGMIVR